ncbi:MAG TPA: FtsX-like permease family protein [Bryobacteraceae bacterium]|nr:FtsX-like permease family protein [Bryobacteraceae bacterium]
MNWLILFARLIVRPLRKEPVRTALTISAVALGVAVVLAIELAGEAAAGSFQSSMETMAGDADYEVTSAGGIPPVVLRDLALLPVPMRLRPRIESHGSVNGRSVPLLGVDVLAEEAAADGDADIAGDRDQIWVGPQLGSKAGDRLRVVVEDRELEFKVGGVLPENAGDAVVMDLATATRALRRPDGALDRILIDASADVEPQLRKALPAGVELQPYGAQTAENRRMLEAFRWNLRVLSYIALVVGAFLIYNTVSVSVVRRRHEIGIVRGLGASRMAVLLAFLSEAVTFGVAGGVAGAVLGRIMAEGAVVAVSVTVQSLYVSSRPGEIHLTASSVLFALAVAVALSVLSALSPALEASGVQPVEAMARGRAEHAFRLSATRSGALAAAFGVLAWIAAKQPAIGGKPLFGYVSAFALIAALAFLMAPLIGILSGKTGVRLGRAFGVEALLASRSLAASRRRSAVLAGALATAIAMTAAVGIMVGSFRQTVLLWMSDQLQADLYLRPASAASADRHPSIDPAVIQELTALPEIAAVDRFRATEIWYNGRRATFAGLDASTVSQHGSRALLSGNDPRVVFRKLATEPDTAVISEPFAEKHGVKAGDRISFSLAGRVATFRVLDVYYDYSSERGNVLVNWRTMTRYQPGEAPSSIALYLKPGVDLEAGRRAVENAIRHRKILLFTNRSLREEAIRIFDRTFAITYALEAVAVAVSVMGVAGALLALVIDRRRELGLLRVLGAAQGQIRRLIIAEAALLGLLANLAGLGLGLLLSLVLIHVINKQSFGWTIQFHWPVAVLLGALTLVYLATVVSALYPARIATRINPIEVLHEE